MAKLTFLGAARTVTGSKYLLEAAGKRVLIDCGLFQGEKALRQRNWQDTPADAASIDAVVLTHAHVDHTGSLPRLVRRGFRGPVHCTPATLDLTAILLRDSAHLQEEEAETANRLGYSRHAPALPLYEVADVERTLPLLHGTRYGTPIELARGITLTFHRAGHILGSAIVQLDLVDGGEHKRLVFTGDLGRYDAPIIPDPEPVARATVLVAETTYGDRKHATASPRDLLDQELNAAFAAGGVVVVPSFAVGRTQELLFHVRALEDAKRIPEVPVFVDSPMACDVTPLYLKHLSDHDPEMRGLLAAGSAPLYPARVRFTRALEESKAIAQHRGPGLIISASGMATGGRVLHHLAQRLPYAENTILFVGYQSSGTRGRRMQNGEKFIRIHGGDVAVRARIRTVSGFSAHADFTEMLRWMDGFQSPPGRIFLTHGEWSAMCAMRDRLAERNWPAETPDHGETVEF